MTWASSSPPSLRIADLIPVDPRVEGDIESGYKYLVRHAEPCTTWYIGEAMSYNEDEEDGPGWDFHIEAEAMPLTPCSCEGGYMVDQWSNVMAFQIVVEFP